MGGVVRGQSSLSVSPGFVMAEAFSQANRGAQPASDGAAKGIPLPGKWLVKTKTKRQNFL